MLQIGSPEEAIPLSVQALPQDARNACQDLEKLIRKAKMGTALSLVGFVDDASEPADDTAGQSVGRSWTLSRSHHLMVRVRRLAAVAALQAGQLDTTVKQMARALYGRLEALGLWAGTASFSTVIDLTLLLKTASNIPNHEVEATDVLHQWLEMARWLCQGGDDPPPDLMVAGLLAAPLESECVAGRAEEVNSHTVGQALKRFF